jgi:hypothetical protein
MSRLSRLACLALCLIPLGPALPADTPATDTALPTFEELYKSGKLFDKKEYKTVRAACSRAFEETHADKIRQAYGADEKAFSEWLARNPELKQDFYTALDPEHDNLPAALELFKELWKKNPEAFLKYSNLAIALAVTWDEPQKGVYDYRYHARRTKSPVPDSVDRIGAFDNFQFFIDHARQMQGKETVDRIQILPWEFLVYVVNHRTPVEERDWALKNYLSKRVMVGKIYSEIEYDKVMLQTQSQTCKLNGKDYTLANIKTYGGVCAMQADFASRVGKSLCVPAAYVRGESAQQELHAWVMWVEVRAVTKGQINFTLESHGRYLGDQYYTGELADPQTGQKILDRDMERRLAVVAMDKQAKRQAELAMRIFPGLSDKLNLDTKGRLAYLDKVLKVSPYNEAVWLELARMAKVGELTADFLPAVMAHVDTMFKSFANYPDFTWKIVNDLLALQTNKVQRNSVYQRMVALYEQANRPDLACDARMLWMDFLVEEKKWSTAAAGLAYTINKFPSEGRYVPRMLNKMKEVCSNYPGGKDKMGQTYKELLTKIPPKRGDTPTRYCINTFKEAIAFFRESKQDKLADQLQLQLQALQGSRSQ